MVQAIIRLYVQEYEVTGFEAVSVIDQENPRPRCSSCPKDASE